VWGEFAVVGVFCKPDAYRRVGVKFFLGVDFSVGKINTENGPDSEDSVLDKK
jgi:hypothetical protein